MSAAAMAGRVGGPTYLSGSSLGTAGDGVAALEATAPVDRAADEQAPSVIADHASTDGKDFTCTPRKVETGAGCRSLPRRLPDQQGRFKRHIQTGLYRADYDPSRPRGPVPGSLNQFFPFVPAGSPPWKIPAGACGLSGIPGTASIFFWRGHTSSNVLPS